MNSSTTKKTLTISIISIFVCIAALVGATYAWFTDNASTGVNKIQAGTLDIQLLDEDGNDLVGQTLDFVDANGKTDILFEPGATFKTNGFKVHQNGNLEFKYKIEISGIDGDEKLLEAINFSIVDEDGTTIDLDVFEGHSVDFVGTWEVTYDPETGKNITTQIAGMDSKLMYLQASMKKEAGNEYQGLTMSGIAITVQATQDTVEYDSIDDQYDAGATYDKLETAADIAELKEVIANTTVDEPVIISVAAGSYTLPTKDMQNKDITIIGGKDVVIDLSSANSSVTQAATGATVTLEGVTINFDATKNYQGLAHTEKVTFKDCVINGKFCLYSDAEFINCTFNNSADYSVWTWGSENVTFTDCTFKSGGKALLVYTEVSTGLTANVTLNNCKFYDDGTLTTSKAAVEVGSNPKNANTFYNITMTNCTVDGFAVNNEGINTGSTLYGNKNSMDKDHLNVVIDGVDVY